MLRPFVSTVSPFLQAALSPSPLPLPSLSCRLIVQHWNGVLPPTLADHHNACIVVNARLRSCNRHHSTLQVHSVLCIIPDARPALYLLRLQQLIPFSQLSGCCAASVTL
ncbi:hypothetical protein B0J15DRAFT_234421 [Fusarium solani]|uniref:Uncharacterized protein n=1 Tax=Fusarium solani TaxID=169388 RepID=A0A9P9KNN3_FUSSL|nr:uncharacterized protein B0J15DRAFT_234421 [Fusarium solani]KAH7265755.1 hypothetical protein B0J15DRAFT_234421 [Fusarium solani]